MVLLEKKRTDFTKEEELRDTVFLVLANKQDLPNAMSTDEVVAKLGLLKLLENRFFILF